jgi:hypothetical protein
VAESLGIDDLIILDYGYRHAGGAFLGHPGYGIGLQILQPIGPDFVRIENERQDHQATANPDHAVQDLLGHFHCSSSGIQINTRTLLIRQPPPSDPVETFIDLDRKLCVPYFTGGLAFGGLDQNKFRQKTKQRLTKKNSFGELD